MFGAIETGRREFGPTGFMPRPYAEVRARAGERSIVLRRRSTLDLGNRGKNTFPGALQIVDLYHGPGKHLSNLAKIVYEVGSLRWKQWLATRI